MSSLQDKLSSLVAGTPKQVVPVKVVPQSANASASASSKSERNDILSRSLAASRSSNVPKNAKDESRDTGKNFKDDEKVCFAFQKTGKCDKGNRCRFSHGSGSRKNRLLAAAEDQGVAGRSQKRAR